MTGSNELSVTMKCDFFKGLYSEAAGGGGCGEGKINKTLLMPKNKPLRMLTLCYHVNGAGVFRDLSDEERVMSQKLPWREDSILGQ